jgi:beta-lactamase regulating signal transducer with metallopeptidase domain
VLCIFLAFKKRIERERFSMSGTQSTKKRSAAGGIAMAVVGIILIIAGAGYALYRRYIIGHTTLTKLAVNPIVDLLGIVGVILIIIGIAMYYRMKEKAPKSPAQGGETTTSQMTGDAQQK